MIKEVKQIENYPEFWEEIVEKDYEIIIGYKNTGIKEINLTKNGLRIITDANGEGCVTSRLGWKLENCVKEKQPLFTTEDGVNIYNGDVYYEIHYLNHPQYEKILKFKAVENSEESYNNGQITFSNKEAAEEYIIMNKPCLSLKDIEDFKFVKGSEIDIYQRWFSKLKELVKTKLK